MKAKFVKADHFLRLTLVLVIAAAVAVTIGITAYLLGPDGLAALMGSGAAFLATFRLVDSVLPNSRSYRTLRKSRNCGCNSTSRAPSRRQDHVY